MTQEDIAHLFAILEQAAKEVRQRVVDKKLVFKPKRHWMKTDQPLRGRPKKKKAPEIRKKRTANCVEHDRERTPQ